MFTMMEICLWCKEEMDPEMCWCGDYMHAGDEWYGHTGVPMGCICGYYKAPKISTDPADLVGFDVD